MVIVSPIIRMQGHTLVRRAHTVSSPHSTWFCCLKRLIRIKNGGFLIGLIRVKNGGFLVWGKNRGVWEKNGVFWGKSGGSAGPCTSCWGGYKEYRVAGQHRRSLEDTARLAEGGWREGRAGRGYLGGGGDVPDPWERRDCVRRAANVSE